MVDLFCGAGGFSLGFEQAGFSIAAGFDNDPRTVSAFRRNFPAATAAVGNLTAATGSELLAASSLSSCAVVIGGPPCQAFSIAGHRRPDDVRRDLVGQFGRLIDEMRPDYFVMENVPGILLPDAQPVVGQFRAHLEASGYQISSPWRLRATDFGVPQRRLRVFYVGAQTGLPMPQRPYPIFVAAPSARDAINDLREDLPDPENPISEYAARMRGDVDMRKRRSSVRQQSSHAPDSEKVAHTEEVVMRFAAVKPGEVEPISRFYRLHPDMPAPTLRAGTLADRGSHTAARPIHYALPRCITVREAARLQSMPDSFHVDPTKWRGYMQVGNSVPPLVARAIAEQIAAAASSRPARASSTPDDLLRTG